MKNKLGNNIGNNQLGMRWFDFFYKFSLPLGIIVSIANLANFIQSAYYLDAVLQVIYIAFAVTLVVLYRSKKGAPIRCYPAILYPLTLTFLIYLTIVNTLTNYASIFVWIIYLVLNIVYFSKRKHLFISGN